MGGAGPTVLPLNSRSARGVSGTRDRLSQNFRRLVIGGGEESVVDFASIDSCRFRLRGIGVFSEGIESQSCDTSYFNG